MKFTTTKEPLWVLLLNATLVASLILLFGNEVEGKNGGGIDDGVDKKAVLTRPLNQGIYQFSDDGFVPKAPLKRLRSVHSEMINTLRTVSDSSKLLRYLISIGNTVQEDVQTLRQKLEGANIADGKDVDKKSLKADAFVFLAGHASLISHLVMYFPDIMSRLFKKNPEFETNAKWIIRFTADAKLVNEEKTAEILNLAQQELEMIPRDADFQNPYRLENLLKQDSPSPITTTTKKPRKKLQRGPRLTAGEL
ncbi:hypothetical protein Ocin01_09231 [Orchesella cincta]|uniref:Uncharacterized protein n=1 Tax=Orchesella cincta TaxID=48709 RepID=A0A1D2MWN6_ORCCI|nr:hypothetical protein Ocin01_09231 [Orchesella cincta]